MSYAGGPHLPLRGQVANADICEPKFMPWLLVCVLVGMCLHSSSNAAPYMY